jgi:hypothetical protein
MLGSHTALTGMPLQVKRPRIAYWILNALVLITPLAIHGEVITRGEIPLDTVVSNPCAVAGGDELVALAGQVHAVFSVTGDANGGWHVSTHFNNQGVTGVGLTTGNKYLGTGGNRYTSRSREAIGEFTFVNRFHLISTGASSNLVIHEIVHVTISANAEVTANVLHVSVGCR